MAMHRVMMARNMSSSVVQQHNDVLDTAAHDQYARWVQDACLLIMFSIAANALIIASVYATPTTGVAKCVVHEKPVHCVVATKRRTSSEHHHHHHHAEEAAVEEDNGKKSLERTACPQQQQQEKNYDNNSKNKSILDMTCPRASDGHWMHVLRGGNGGRRVLQTAAAGTHDVMQMALVSSAAANSVLSACPVRDVVRVATGKGEEDDDGRQMRLQAHDAVLRWQMQEQPQAQKKVLHADHYGGAKTLLWNLYQ